jgi:alpha-ketoglutarate-dependent taurine dioxygenase
MLFPLPRQYLRLMDPSNYDPSTGQRIDKHFDVNSGKPLLAATDLSRLSKFEIDSCFTQRQNVKTSIEEFVGIIESRIRYLNDSVFNADVKNSADAEELFIIKWKDGLVSKFTAEWIAQQIRTWKKNQPNIDTSRDYVVSCKEDCRVSIGNKWILDDCGRVMWKNLTEADIRSFSCHRREKDFVLPPISICFHNIVNKSNVHGYQMPNKSSKTGIDIALEALFRYGFLLVTDTPLQHQAAAVVALASSLSGGSNKSSSRTSLLANYLINENPTTVLPDGTDGALRTLYGHVWTTNSEAMVIGQSVADTAYGQEALPLHTDMAYCRDPPGLQIFSMRKPAAEGGQSTFCDGFSIAETLRETCPKAFSALATTKRRYRSIDNINGWNLQASGPVIQTGPGGKIRSIRYNELDRMPDIPIFSFPMDYQKEKQASEFYEHIEYADYKWNELVAKDEFTLVLELKPGDTVVVANQRCLHGRFSFRNSAEASRSIVGCYVGQDELLSRFRIARLVDDIW